jgi:DinB superfamily
MDHVSDKLGRIVEFAEPILRRVSEDDSATPVLPGGWSRRQLLGRLIDSASNNHQRFVRAALADSLDFPGYDTPGSVAVQHVESAGWGMLVDLWASYNRYLANVIRRLPATKLAVPCRIGSREPVTLGFLVEDYVRHLVHHLGQIGAARL